MALKLFIDYASQPSRAVLWLCLANRIPHEVHQVRILKGEQLAPEFAAINPLQKVPAIQEPDGFALAESHAILQYLCSTRPVAPHWYPSDPKRRARVDQYLHWHHINLRSGAAGLFFSTVVAPRVGRAVSDDALTGHKKLLHVSLKVFTMLNTWLASAPYLAGDEPSLADLSAMCELTQLEPLQVDLSKYPHLLPWKDRMRAQDGYAASHEVWNKVAQGVQSRL